MAQVGQPLWFGQYRLTSRIATGGMAEVFVGRQVTPEGKIGPMVAVKRLLPHLVTEPFIVQMFLNEARITAQIHHPNVVQVLDLGHESGEPFIVMELLEGHAFADIRLRAAEMGRHVPLGVTLRVLCEACLGLHAAHQAVDDKGRQLCIVHRDFTPDNIHVGVDGDVKVIDFGIAKAEHLSAGTEPGTLKGKFFYMSPEMIAGRQVDHRADIFAAGVMLYEQLCGRRPFTGTSTDEVLQRISEGRQKRPTEFDPSVPVGLEAICQRALAPKPEQRFASLEEFVNAIEAVGGVAQLASHAEVAAYMNEVFPIEQDPKRLTLRRARQADPSNVRVSRPSEGAPTEPPPLGLLQPPAVAPQPQSIPSIRIPKRTLIFAGVALGVLALAIGGGVAASKLFPKKTVATRLEEAQALKDPSSRQRALRRVAEDPTATASQLRRVGELLLASSAFDDALSVAETYVQRFPKDESARLIEARACMGLRQGKRAEVAIAQASLLNPQDPQPDLVLADLKELEGDYQPALEALGRAAKKQPSRSLNARRGMLLSQLGRLDEASEALNAVLQKRFDPDAAAELGFVRYREDKLSEASTMLRRALKEDPKLAKAHYYLGAVLYRQGDLKAAEHEYREADGLAPTDPRALVALCQMAKNSGQAKAAEETRAKIDERFASQAQALKAQCAP